MIPLETRLNLMGALPVEDLHDSLSENEEEIAWVNDAVELQMVLSEDFTEFSQYRDKVIGLDESEHSK